MIFFYVHFRHTFFIFNQSFLSLNINELVNLLSQEQNYYLLMRKNDYLNSQISEDHSQHSDHDNDSEEEVEQRFVPRVDRNLNYEPDLNRIVINVACIDHIKEVANLLGLAVVSDPCQRNWDLCWTDHAITPQTFIRMHFHQTINYIPGIHTIARKNELGARLNQMKALLPDQYNFHPLTWMLPQEFPQLRKYMEGEGRGCTFIVKPQADCQGRGIYLINKLDDIYIGRHCVVQKYVDNPLLIDQYKFDLRVYVLIGSIDPLRIYLYHDGLARFATQPYQAAQRNNFKSTFQHLTNYAVNKLNPKFKASQSGGESEGGFKRSMKTVLKNLSEEGVDTEKIWSKIGEIAIKTIILGYQKFRHNYVSCQPEEYHNHMAFHILGLDIMISDSYQPILLEVNHTPSFATETSLDQRIKTSLIKDTLLLLRCQDIKLKQELFQKSKTYSFNRIQQGKRQVLQEQVRISEIEVMLKDRIQYESNRFGGYCLIYPTKDEELNKLYTNLIEKTKKTLHKRVPIIKDKGSSMNRQQKQIRKDKLREHQNIAPFKDKKLDSQKLKSLSIYSERIKPQSQIVQNNLINFINGNLSVPPFNLTHSTISSQHSKHGRTFTIKTKLSVPEVHRKPSTKCFKSEIRQIKQIKQEKQSRQKKQKDNKPLIKCFRGGSFLKPKTYDVPALTITSYFPDQQRIIRKKNKEGRFIFHVAKS